MAPASSVEVKPVDGVTADVVVVVGGAAFDRVDLEESRPPVARVIDRRADLPRRVIPATAEGGAPRRV